MPRDSGPRSGGCCRRGAGRTTGCEAEEEGNASDMGHDRPLSPCCGQDLRSHPNALRSDPHRDDAAGGAACFVQRRPGWLGFEPRSVAFQSRVS